MDLIRMARDFGKEIQSSDEYIALAAAQQAADEDQELQQTLAQGISSLQQNEQIVLSLYYEKNLHMKEIAQVMGVSEPRISQIHSRAIQKLRDHMGAYMNNGTSPKSSKKRKKA